MKITSLVRPALILACCATLAGLFGCATVDQNISLNYSGTDDARGRHSGEISVIRLSADSAAKNSGGEWIVGSLNNVHGVHQADLLSARNPDEWITDAFLYELNKAGYTANHRKSFPAGVAHGIAITDISVFMNIDKGNVTSDTKQELKFNIEIYRNGAKVKTLTVASRDKSTVAFAASRDKMESIMRQSLQDALRRILPETITLIDEK